ncbi:10354_t:CDS:1, partial [Paraglomus occultum]
DPMFSATSSDSQISSDFRFADTMASAALSAFSRDPIAAIQFNTACRSGWFDVLRVSYDSARISDFVGSTITQAIGTYKAAIVIRIK